MAVKEAPAVAPKAEPKADIRLVGIEPIAKGDSFPDRETYIYHAREAGPLIRLKNEEMHPTIEGRLTKEALIAEFRGYFYICTDVPAHKLSAKEMAKLLWDDLRNWQIYHLMGACEVCLNSEAVGSTGIIKVKTIASADSEKPMGWAIKKEAEYQIRR